MNCINSQGFKSPFALVHYRSSGELIAHSNTDSSPLSLPFPEMHKSICKTLFR